MNIIQEFGSRYINERCADSVFLHPDGWVGMFIRADPERERVSVKKIQGTVGRISVSDEELHYDFFHSLSVFNIPELGWRAGLNGRALLYYSHTGGYGRGIRPGRNVRAFHSGTTEAFIANRGVSSSYLNRIDVQAHMLAKPTYLTLAEGMKLLREGSHAGFAVNEVLAVSASDEPDVGIIYVRTKEVGTLDLNTGTIRSSISIPSIDLSGVEAA